MTDRTAETIILHDDRKYYLRSLWGSALTNMTVASVLAYFAFMKWAVFFVVLALLCFGFLVCLKRSPPRRLELRPEGLTFFDLKRGTLSFNWSASGPFEIQEILTSFLTNSGRGLLEMESPKSFIVWKWMEGQRPENGRDRCVLVGNRDLKGYDAHIPFTVGMTNEEMCKLLNDYRTAYLAKG